MSRYWKIHTFVWIMAVSFACVVLYHLIMSDLLHKEYPYNTYLFNPAFRFTDFAEMLDICSANDPYGNKQHCSLYFPSANLFFYIVHLFNSPHLFYIYLLSIFVFIGWYFSRAIQFTTHNFYCVSGLIAILNYPAQFAADRGNIEGLVFIFVALFFILFDKEKDVLAAVFLSLAASFKGFPGIFVLIPLAYKRYRCAYLCVTFTGFLTMFALASFSGGLIANIQNIIHNYGYSSHVNNMLGANTLYVVSEHLSLFNSLKILLIQLNVTEYFSYGTIRTLSVVVCILLAIGSIYYVFRERQYWKQIFLLTAVVTLAPDVSAPYKLLFFYVPLFYFFQSDPAHDDKVNLILFSMLLMPFSLFVMPQMNIPGHIGYPDIQIYSAFRSLVILYICFRILFRPRPMAFSCFLELSIFRRFSRSHVAFRG